MERVPFAELLGQLTDRTWIGGLLAGLFVKFRGLCYRFYRC